MEIKKVTLAVAAVCSVYAASASAAVDGSGDVSLNLAMQVINDNNLFSANTAALSSTITMLKPSVEWSLEEGNNAYRVTYGLEQGSYSNLSAGNYTDHSLVAEAYVEIDSRNRLDLTGTYLWEHDDIGSATATSTSKYNDTDLSGVYRYGVEGAAGNIELSTSLLGHTYVNSADAAGDRDNTLLGAVFYYKVAPKTSSVFEVRHEGIDYKDATKTLDGTERQYLGGVEWDATGQTSGSAKVGYATKSFASAARENQGTFTWELAVKWAPLTYSTIDLTTDRAYDESTGTGDASNGVNFGIAWAHDWNDQMSTKASFATADTSYVGVASGTDTESQATMTLGVDYKLSEGLSGNLEYVNINKTSTVAGAGSDRNKLTMMVTGSL